jgi:hypothetical protein
LITRTRLFALLIFLLMTGYFAAGRSHTRSAAQSKDSTPVSNASPVSEGEKRFQANCGRCHQPPENISPREAVAVVRQMRVRAMLSVEDERLILKFLAP